MIKARMNISDTPKTPGPITLIGKGPLYNVIVALLFELYHLAGLVRDRDGIGRSQPIRPRFQHHFGGRPITNPPCCLDLQTLGVFFDEFDRFNRSAAGGVETCGRFNEVAAGFADGPAGSGDSRIPALRAEGGQYCRIAEYFY